MHLQSATLNNFRCFEHLEIALNPDINIFVGNNGSGKSALLDAIACALFPYLSRLQTLGGKVGYLESPALLQDFLVKEDASKQSAEIRFTISTNTLPTWEAVYRNDASSKDNNTINPDWKLFRKSYDRTLYSHDLELQPKRDAALPVIAYYPSNRNLEKLTDIKNIPHKFDRYGALNHCLNASAHFNDLVNWFFFREFEELREARDKGDITLELLDLRLVRNAVSTIIEPSSRVYFSQATNGQLMVEWETETGEFKKLLLSQLSAGYRNMLALVMDFARRLAQANPHLENPLATEAILMIDELDLHLHPKWQQKIVLDLRKVFPNTQIIATTHSPEIVTTVEQHQVWILEDYQVKSCPSPTKGMKSSDIVRYVLGLENLRPDTDEASDITELFNAIDAENLNEAKRLQEKLKDLTNFDADLRRAEMQIRRLERRNAV